jgi:asparagine synthetase B (glutamine-hydrolysing)
VFCWNGEAWNIEHVAVKDSDTLAIYSRFGQALEACQSADASSMLETVASAMAEIAGPFAFIYYDERNECLYFGRDFLGRRSLLYHITPDGSILLCSVSDRKVTSDWLEVQADGLYCIDLLSVPPPENRHTANELRWGGFRILRHDYIRKRDGDVACSSVGRFVKTGRH